MLYINLKILFDMQIQLQKLDTGNRNNRKCAWYLNYRRRIVPGWNGK